MLKWLIKYSSNKFKLHYLISYLDVTEPAELFIVSCPINFSMIVHQDKQFQWIKWCFKNISYSLGKYFNSRSSS